MYSRLKSRTLSANPRGFKGVEKFTEDQMLQVNNLISATLHLKVKVESDAEHLYLDLNPYPDECKSLEASYTKIKLDFGFVSSAAIIIADYVDFYMLRYHGKPEREQDVREGLIAEKAFDLILQNSAIYHQYPEPVRDWRIGSKAPFPQPCDCYIPLIGKLEVKSVTDYKGSNRVNIPDDDWQREHADYVIALSHLDRYVMLHGAMPATMVNSECYDKLPYHIMHSESPRFTGPFRSIPLEHFPITGFKFHEALLKSNAALDEMPLRPIATS